MKVTKQLDASLRDGVSKLMAFTRTRKFTFELDKFISLYWTDEDKQHVEFVMRNVANYQLDEMTPTYRRYINVRHPVYPDNIHTEFTFNIQQPSGRKVLWPSNLNSLHGGHDPQTVAELDEVLKDMVIYRTDAALVREVCDFVLDECQTIEQMRYLFPPIMTVLRFAGEHDLSQDIDTVRKAQKMPAMPYLMRQKIKHVMDWFAVMELTEGFTHKAEAFNYKDMSVTMGSNYTMQYVDVDSGDSYTVKVGA